MVLALSERVLSFIKICFDLQLFSLLIRCCHRDFSC